MNPMQQMMMQAQRIQRELARAHEELNAKVFSCKKAGIVEVEIYGNRQIKSIKIDEAALNPDDKDMIEDTILMAINELLSQIQAENDAIEEKITGKTGLGL